MAKTKSGRHQLDIFDELQDVLLEFSDDLLEQKEIALDKASAYIADEFVKNTPTGAETFEDRMKTKDSWIATVSERETSRSTGLSSLVRKPYKNVRYIGNSATASRGTNKNIPIVNLLEFSRNGKPFVRKTFDSNKEKIIQIIKGELQK